jgi:hypothetical protein
MPASYTYSHISCRESILAVIHTAGLANPLLFPDSKLRRFLFTDQHEVEFSQPKSQIALSFAVQQSVLSAPRVLPLRLGQPLPTIRCRK